MDSETWLRNASSPPSETEDDKREKTEQQIRDALASYAPLQGKNYEIYAKGSYANNTNVRLNYDVDIAVEYRGYFYYDLCFDLKGQPKEVVGIEASTDPYTRDAFKADIKKALENAFGATAVSTGKIAHRVREKKTTLPADVVPCWDYMRYDRIDDGVPIFHNGSCLFPTGGSRTVNYPAQQKANGNDKNSRTNKRYKRMVRALKKLQTLLVDEGVLSAELPSYLIECLVYNVPPGAFGHDAYLSDMRDVLAAIFNSTLESGNWNDWEEVNRFKYLYRGKPDWTHAQVHALADAAWSRLGLE